MAKKYYWLKLSQSFFNDKAIKKLRKMTDGYIYIVIYMKLMLLSLNDEGRLYYDGIEETIHEELALEIDEDVEKIQITLKNLKQIGLLEEISNNEIFLTQVPETIGSETDKAILMRKSRQKRKILENGNNVTDVLPPVTSCYPEKEIDTDLEKKEREEIYQKIADFFNSLCPSFPEIKIISDTVKQNLEFSLHKFNEDDFITLFKKAEASNFLKGENERNWIASFDWLIQADNIAKVLNGNYDNRKSKSSKYSASYDIDELERNIDIM